MMGMRFPSVRSKSASRPRIAARVPDLARLCGAFVRHQRAIRVKQPIKIGTLVFAQLGAFPHKSTAAWLQ